MANKTNRLAAMKRAVAKPGDTRGVGRAKPGFQPWAEGSRREEATESSNYEQQEDGRGAS